MSDSIDFSSFSLRSYLPLISKDSVNFPLFVRDSVNRMYHFVVYAKEELPIARNLSLENSKDSYLCFK